MTRRNSSNTYLLTTIIILLIWLLGINWPWYLNHKGAEIARKQVNNHIGLINHYVRQYDEFPKTFPELDVFSHNRFQKIDFQDPWQSPIHHHFYTEQRALAISYGKDFRVNTLSSTPDIFFSNFDLPFEKGLEDFILFGPTGGLGCAGLKSGSTTAMVMTTESFHRKLLILANGRLFLPPHEAVNQFTIAGRNDETIIFSADNDKRYSAGIYSYSLETGNYTQHYKSDDQLAFSSSLLIHNQENSETVNFISYSKPDQLVDSLFGRTLADIYRLRVPSGSGATLEIIKNGVHSFEKSLLKNDYTCKTPTSNQELFCDPKREASFSRSTKNLQDLVANHPNQCFTPYYQLRIAIYYLSYLANNNPDNDTEKKLKSLLLENLDLLKTRGDTPYWLYDLSRRLWERTLEGERFRVNQFFSQP